MAHRIKHWGEFEDDEQLAYVPRGSLNALVESSLQPPPPAPRADVAAKRVLVELPVPNLTLQTVKLVEHNGRAAAAMAAGEVPPSPPDGALFHGGAVKFEKTMHASTSYQNDHTRPTPTLGAAARKLALGQAAALILATLPGLVAVTRSVLDTLSDSLEQYLRVLTCTMRTVVDKEAGGHPSGFPDVLTKVFTELGVSGLQSWYKENVLGKYDAAQKGFEEVPIAEIPQLHFPAGLEELSDSLEPGFQMLQTLESGQLPTLHLLDGDSTDNLDLAEALLDEAAASSPPVASPTVKKKRKLNHDM